MFESAQKPRLFGVPPGVDFPADIVDRCLKAYRDQPPDALARLHIIVNTERMRRRLIDLFSDGTARLLPRITPLTAIDRLVPRRTASHRNLQTAPHTGARPLD